MLWRFQKAAKMIERNLVIFLILSIIAGIAFGTAFPEAAKGLKSFTTLTLFVMLYPMMIGLRLDADTGGRLGGN